MNDVDKAAAETKKLARQFKAVLALAEVADDVARLGGERDALRLAVNKARNDLAAVQKEVGAAKDEAERVARDSRALKNANMAAMEAAHKEAAYVVKQAKKEAEEIKDEASEYVVELRGRMDYEMEVHKKEVDALVKEKNMLGKAVDAFKNELAALKARY